MTVMPPMTVACNYVTTKVTTLNAPPEKIKKAEELSRINE